MSAEHDALRVALGGYVLGTLPPAEMEHVRAHLAGCAECRAEHAQLAGLPALLATVTAAEAAGQTVPAGGDLADRLVARAAESAQGSPPARPAVPQAPESGVLEGLLQRAAARRRRTWRLQLAGAAASLMFIAAAAGGTWLAVVGSVGPQATRPAPTAPAATRTFSGSDPATGVTASVKVSPSAWGSVLQVSAKGAPAGITCRLQAVGPGGARADAATWRAGEYPPGTTIPGAVAMSPAAIEHFEIYADNGQKLVTIRA
ncbi:zf-HC2 domain-containing protein (plasmid) [Streptomyces sp. NBC_01340]|uniref:anti-sigma factor n=1 Tax=unclassified Streptomyces TaxID=2593676 RepID=UPI0022511B79|nr:MULTISPECIES: zf-HC2 domain-containing protein [unclassified Streptomyces]MCX4462277.1 zf-HC2 domain-containing protein [Streptomyces sp. NBC_01719]MCX4500715.1 zf-HC2 domain-containing protein [Streptomyces sp. NBC_01728]MCX4598670.1 zf-HC2 domain-containing protein [Streptomyces sp. NBC_01549]WSI35926.1 zf-HC2 domain-containing protein [Streptomyces sp. NBC_01340]WSI43886.1 zf-HC2 domain-containing protein [Streptomyces sp. NBC_01340]